MHVLRSWYVRYFYHSTCMFDGHSSCIMSYKAQLRRNFGWGRGGRSRWESMGWLGGRWFSQHLTFAITSTAPVHPPLPPEINYPGKQFRTTFHVLFADTSPSAPHRCFPEGFASQTHALQLYHDHGTCLYCDHSTCMAHACTVTMLQ